MVDLPPGQFLMGSSLEEEELAGNAPRREESVLAERPQVLVEIAYPMAIGKYEVTEPFHGLPSRECHALVATGASPENRDQLARRTDTG